MFKTTQEKVKEDKLATPKSLLHLLPDCGDGAVCHCVCVCGGKGQLARAGSLRLSSDCQAKQQAPSLASSSPDFSFLGSQWP